MNGSLPPEAVAGVARATSRPGERPVARAILGTMPASSPHRPRAADPPRSLAPTRCRMPAWRFLVGVLLVAGLVPGGARPAAAGAASSLGAVGVAAALAGAAQTATQAGDEAELDDLVVVPIDPAADPAVTMRRRPFI